MSGICGWAGHAGADGDVRAWISRMAEPLAEADRVEVRTWTAQDAALAAAALGGPAGLASRDGLAVALAGRPHFDDEGLAETARREGAASALVEGYRASGARVWELLLGGWAAAIVDTRDDTVVLAADRVGIEPLYYQADPKGVVFGSTGHAIDVHPHGRAEIDPQGVYHYLYFGCSAAPGTVWRGRRRLLPGTCVTIRQGGADTRAYWTPAYEDDARVSLRDLADEFRDVFRACVRRAAEGARVGAFLSGGLDSSAVAGVLAEVSDGPARTYSIGFEAQGYDEMGYARITARRFGTDHHEYYVTPSDVEAMVPRIARAYSEPFGNESAVPTYYCATLAREDGVERLLAGDGGDEIFAGNERYATQKVFALWQRVPGPLRRCLLEPALRAVPWGDAIWPVRKARSYVRQANVAMPGRLQRWNVVERAGLANVFTPEFLERIDPERPRELMKEVYFGARARNMLNRMLALDMKFTLADSDLRKVGTMCDLAGMQVAYPLLDPALVDLAARVPADMKLRRLRLRHFFKEALADFLAPETITKRKQGFGLPFGVWLRTHEPLQSLARESLAQLRRREILKPDFLDRVAHAHETQHAAYYGAMIWSLMMLEQWYQVHVDGALRPVPSGER